jgi:hypothetical protein
VVLDEAHHAAAATYQAILAHVRPKVLLGLTATPERADGLDIRKDFGSDAPELAGRFTHELRWPDAIERRLLAPFHYFGVSDHENVDFTNLKWRAGGYAASELDGVLGANDARAQWVRDQFVELVADPARVRGLGFCVSQKHARFMARKFTERGVPSAALTADSPQEERNRVQGDLVHRRIRFIFTVDLYNEGVDIPEVDTVLRSLAMPDAVRGAGVLQLHAQYTREQILLALGKGSFADPYTHREGVLHVAERKVDAFFVTIRKTEARFSPSTMYEDYATSEGIFHWQSQSTTSEASPTGQRYIEHRKRGYTLLLFVRESHKLENGLTAPFWFLGPLQYMRHEGDRPMSMTWRLERAMPARVYRWAREVA